jgi:hypothetical protein
MIADAIFLILLIRRQKKKIRRQRMKEFADRMRGVAGAMLKKHNRAMD